MLCTSDKIIFLINALPIASQHVYNKFQILSMAYMALM